MYAYITAIPTLLKARCASKSFEHFVSLEAIDEAMRACAAAQVEHTMRHFMASSVPKLKLVNEVAALDTVEMAQIHMKYVTFKLMGESVAEL